MASSKPKIINQTIQYDNLEQGSLAVVREIMHDWKDKDIKYKVLDGGFANKIGCCYLSSDVNMEKAMVVRTYGLAPDTIVSRDREVSAMQMISAQGCCQPLHGIFNNGHVYGFAQGRSLEYKEWSNPNIIRKLATLIAKVHNIDTDSATIVDRTGDQTVFSTTIEKTMRTSARECVHQIPEKYDDPECQKFFDEVCHSQESLKKEIQEMEDYLHSLDIPVSLIHGDFQPRNIVYNEQTGEMNFVDFELTSYEFRCVDLSRLFGTKEAFTLVGIANKSDPELSEETQKLWMKCYLEATYDIKGKNKSLITEDEIDALFTEHFIFGIINKLFMAVFMMTRIPSGAVNMDMLRVPELLMTDYKNEKEKLGDLKLRLASLRQSSKSKV